MLSNWQYIGNQVWHFQKMPHSHKDGAFSKNAFFSLGLTLSGPDVPLDGPLDFYLVIKHDLVIKHFLVIKYCLVIQSYLVMKHDLVINSSVVIKAKQ